jgi:hypothetical protein
MMVERLVISPEGRAPSPAIDRTRRGFLDEEWLTPIEIARKFGYATDKPIRRAIKSGELRATRAPCRRRLVVAESEVLRWIDRDLAYHPGIRAEDSTALLAQEPVARSRRSPMPRLRYDASGRQHA